MRVIPLLLFIASTVYAGEGGTSHTLEVFWKGFNIALFLAIVYFFSKKPVSEAFNNFWKSLTEKLDESHKEFEEARRELEKAKRELENAKYKREESIKLAKESAEEDIEKSKREAEEIAQRLSEKTKEAINIELKKAKEELALYGMKKASEIAENTLKEMFKNKNLQKKYIENKLKTIQGGK